jgi:hypothetical protein
LGKGDEIDAEVQKEERKRRCGDEGMGRKLFASDNCKEGSSIDGRRPDGL